MKTATKLLGGAAAGLALGVAASMFLSSKKGKALKENVKETVADFYKHISPQLKKIGTMGQQEYQEFMEAAVQKYAKAKKLSKETGKELASQIQKSWRHFAQNLE
ncbi:MAG: hypothetical protein A3C50_01590 [Candidatus Staskawiczbacteria bacterium RIFCSPHIGHO2_02_FULL_43_16]|uniref:YtxH domain-containing protein n=1 Tax=Candidatus Staskawiczbacteria bacterium RIFCSPHIGHO2_01_FULL_41_41 TaxID=1802203 RepID=A0A1G2HUH2_9BACT|nr:MAG: hypothetical protein A2822_04005 [Candidatus Staskawiczbacteria bacterium RIFCSPHIGHO2_01_FULL_41_41]OGZ69073.1 MAG: hypothetical protein A3C50_01590 [Candidatus Staskawiczbacteria bacterium RIFCSPHIGHO2_02_FULL_43_16]OGZ74500.1 MAG: hypothetical protein A3A12_01900 [Candidatus Staskawiczbacteria bacterium RIFCSPLOWO2_01_FULL_43_17b]